MQVQEVSDDKPVMTKNAELLDQVRTLMRVMLVSERTSPEHQQVMRYSALDFHTLGMLRERSVLRASDVADDLGVAPTTISSAVARLVKRGLIARTQSDTDRRAYDLRLTEEGQQIAQAIHSQDLRNMELFLSALAPEEQETLITLLSKVATRVAALEGSG